MISLVKLFLLYLAASQLILNSNCQITSDAREYNISLSDIKLNDGETVNKVVTEQDKVDTIVRSLSYLPAEERQRLGIDVTATTRIAAGSPEADYLHEMWNLRQQELHKAMEEVIKPAEMMAELAQKLTTDEDNNPEYRVGVLHELEYLLTDVDNARDFHTIGAWPTLVSMLLPDQPVSVRTAAAWAVGTAVKNDYSYQLWCLETIPNNKHPAKKNKKSWFKNLITATGLGSKTNEDIKRNSSCIELLIDQLDVAPETSDKKAIAQLQSKALYAISAAMRGNVDVQDFILSITIDSNDQNTDPFERVRYFKLTKSLASNGSQFPELTRKVWNAMSDLLEERSYIREELTAHLLQRPKAFDNRNSSSTGIEANAGEERDGNAEETGEALDFLNNLQLMGDVFVTGDLEQRWPVLALETAQSYWEQLKYQLKEFDAKRMAVDRAILQSTLTFLKSLVSQRSVLFMEEHATETAQLLTSMEDKWKPQLNQLVADIISVAEASSAVDPAADAADDSELNLSNEEMFNNTLMEVLEAAKYLHAVLSQQS